MPVLLLFHLILFTSCAHHYYPLHQKGYCIQKKYIDDYSEVEINDKAVFQEGIVDYKVPFLFKADSIIYLKDTIYCQNGGSIIPGPKENLFTFIKNSTS